MSGRPNSRSWSLPSAPALIPGLLLSVAVGMIAWGLGRLEAQLFGHAWIEPLVLAILLGVLIRLVWTPGPRFQPGIGFAAKPVLEVAVALLGATVSAQALASAGLPLLAGVVVFVAVALIGGFAIGRAMGLPARMAILIAAGNAICGNSAIAAVAPVIRAEARDVAAAIAFTAVIGVIVVLLLPFLGAGLGMAQPSYGVLAGLTVYAVPQVLAAAAPMGPVALQVGALIKLARVLMLGPVCFVLGLLAPRLAEVEGEAPTRRPELMQLVPWFIVAFLALLVVRSLGWIDAGLADRISGVVKVLTVLAMAALGLGVDPKGLVRAGPRVAATSLLTVLLLLVLAFIPALLLVGA
ncbi:MAG: putative sulfate exporter family transporter [Caulobacterales bacterium]|nr:putative sulfate exporter family transporter [Caulobacterales bacterium]